MKSTKDYPDEVINFMRAHPLMYHAVYPVHRRPLVVRTNVNYRFTTVAVDQVDAADGRYEVLFLGTGTHAAHRGECSMLRRGPGGHGYHQGWPESCALHHTGAGQRAETLPQDPCPSCRFQPGPPSAPVPIPWIPPRILVLPLARFLSAGPAVQHDSHPTDATSQPGPPLARVLTPGAPPSSLILS